VCVNYETVSRKILYEVFDVQHQPELDWRDEAYQDYAAPIIRRAPSGQREALVASYGMVPKSRIPAGVKKYSTMNARAETVGQLRSYAKSWRAGKLCLVPMQAFYEPNWETGAAVRWRIGMADEAPFAVAGLYTSWPEEHGGESFSFTQLTINADDHPLMRRFHRPGDEKRSLVIIPRASFGAWLDCAEAELARAYFSLRPADEMRAVAAPKPKPAPKARLQEASDGSPAERNLSLF